MITEKYIRVINRSTDGLKKTQRRDKEKEEWCKSHNIHVLRIDDTVDKNDYQPIVVRFVNKVIRSDGVLIEKVGTRYNKS